MALSLGAIPAPVYRQKQFDPNTRNPNAVLLRSHGARPATLEKISGVFWEKNVGADDRPQYVQAREGEDGAVPRVRVTVAFTTLRNLDNEKLVLSTKWTASTGPKANLTKLIAGILGIAPEHVAARKDLDLATLFGAQVLATTKAGNREQIAVLTTIVAAASDDDAGNAVVAPPSASPARAAAPAPSRAGSAPVTFRDADDLLDEYRAAASPRFAPPMIDDEYDFPEGHEDEIPF